MPAFPVLCSGCFRAGYCADSGHCEVSLILTSLLMLVILWFRFLRVFLLLLDGLVCVVVLGGSSLFRWLAWFEC